MKVHNRFKQFLLILLVSCAASVYAGESPTLTFRKNGEVIRIMSIEEILQLKKEVEIVTVDNPTDSKLHTYQGILLPVLLDQVFGKAWKEFDIVKFKTSDGYQPVIPTESIKKGNGLISTGEKGFQGFQKLQRLNGESVDPGPFFLVWENIKNARSKQDPWLSWPWQITEIELTSIAREYPRSAPRDFKSNAAREGFLAFRQHCIKCHSVNGEGGSVGPELNYPVNVTEYWREEWLVKFIADPQSIRANSRMIPLNREVKDRQAAIRSIIEYLRVMKDNKVQGSVLNKNEVQ